MSDPCGWPMGIHNLQMRCELAWGHEGDHVPVGSAEDPVIAAAEERGRRNGAEEAKDLRELLREARAYLSLRKLKGKITEHESNLLLRLDPGALAPRDSAPDLVVCDYCPEHPHPLNDDGTKCVHPRAPRDSGKGPDPLGVAELFDPAGDEE